MPETQTEICEKCGGEIFAGTNSCAACLLEDALPEPNVEEQLIRKDFGDYELLEEVGRGGQGIVYRARHKSLNRIVALKVLALGHWATKKHLRRFRLETEAIASLDQSGIVPIYEAGEEDGHYYFTMKFVEGDRLDRMKLPIERAASLVAELARSVHYAHERGVLHRDINPRNVIVDKNGKTNLTDFGLAKLLVEEYNTFASTQDLLGTPSYMAPEQVTGATELTQTTDVYGLGTVLYETLTGRAPFVAKTKYAISEQVVKSDPQSPRQLNAKVDADLEAICLKCLEKEPAQRYSSALALAEDLERYLRHEPIQARRIGVTQRTRKFVRRNPTTTAIVVSLGIVLLLGVTIWRARLERPPTTDSAAFDLYMRAKDFFPTASNNNSGRQDLLEAADLLNQAVARDPSYFEAYCALAGVHDSLYLLAHDHTPNRLALAEEALNAAVRLRPDAGETHLAKAIHLYSAYLNYDAALAELDLAGKSLPNDTRVLELVGRLQIRRAHAEEALHAFQCAVELDPRNVYRLQQVTGCYWFMRRYAEVQAIYDRALVIEPNNAQVKIFRADLDLAWKADTRAVHEVIDSLRSTNPDAIRQNADSWVLCTLADRDPAAAKAALIAAGENTPLNQDAVHFNRAFVEGWIARLEKDEPKARAAFEASRLEQEKVVGAQPDYAPTLCVLGVIDAMLGQKEKAMSECRRAVELLPVEKDALNATLMMQWYAVAAAWVGEKDLALEQLDRAIHTPGFVSYGNLKLLPFWDPLRGDPRFEAMVGTLAPK